MSEISSHTIWAIGGGKGGVGKSVLASNLACGLALGGHKVILIDADLTGANIHTIFGIKYPERTLTDYMKKKVDSINEILIPTTNPNLHLICGASDLIEMSNPRYSQKQRLIRGFDSLSAEFIIIDIGAGASLNNLDFFNMADIGIIVTSPTPTAIQNAYGFLKLSVNRKLITMFPDDTPARNTLLEILEGEERAVDMKQVIDKITDIDRGAAEMISEFLSGNRYRLITNMASEAEGDKISKALAGASSQFLGIKLQYLGNLNFSKEVEKSIRTMNPLMLTTGTLASEYINKILKKALLAFRAPVTSPKIEISVPEAPKAQPPKTQPTRQQPAKASVSVPPKPVITPQTVVSHIAQDNQPATNSSRVQLGLNNDITFEGRVLHVQTEDLGPERAQILTLVFSEGRILFSRSTRYTDLEPNGDLRKSVLERVRWQQSAVLSGISAGKLRDKIVTS